MSETYTDRYVRQYTVKRIDGSTVSSVEGWSATMPLAVQPLLRSGATYELETHGGPFGFIVGWRIDGAWITRKSDQQIERERQELHERIDREHRERLAEYRSEWIGREEMLPGWLKERIHVFHVRGGEKFERDGWGYELVVCELAALYEQSGCEDTDAIDQYARREGTSGNQHDCAKSLARAHREGHSLANTVSALSPFTGDAFYEATS